MQTLSSPRSRDFGAIQSGLNLLLDRGTAALMADDELCSHYESLFDRSLEQGFYGSGQGPRGTGEQPAWQPNPAYMDSLEGLWEPCTRFLSTHGLKLEKTLRELFFESREYKDFQFIHRRVFVGQLVETASNQPVSTFMLTIPHSHKGFEYCCPPAVSISKALTQGGAA